MTATFPQLLKRSAFAAHDSLITRVYASTPQAANIGDWGLKSAVNRSRGSLYIKVSDLDSPMGVGATWSSGEGEARFMSMWGDGSVPWGSKSQRPVRSSIRPDFGFAEELPEPPAQTQMLPNVESMTEAEFERYLAYIRANRDKLRANLHSEGGRAHGAAPEEATLTHAAARGATREGDATDFQSTLMAEDFAADKSTRLRGRPHRLHGLQYSSPASGGADLDPSRAHKGRVLDRTSRFLQSSFRDGVNSKWVVGIGGVTATAASGTNRIADKASLSQFDWSRQRPQAGIAHFAVKDATLNKPPRVIGLFAEGAGGEYWIQSGTSAATRPAPLKSVRFDIDVEEAPSPAEHIDIGSPEWVARDRSRPAATTSESDLGVLGARRANRPRGAGAAAASRMSAKVASENIDNLLAKLQNLKKQ